MVEGRGGEKLWLLKCPIKIHQSGTSPFFEGEAELKKKPNITPVCAANIHQQKNSGLERTYINKTCLQNFYLLLFVQKVLLNTLRLN